MSKACIDRSDSLIFQHKRRPRVIGFTYASSEVPFRSTESQTFYRLIMTADQMSVRELRHDKPSGWFSKSRGLSSSVSFHFSPPPPCSFTCAIFRAVFDSRSSFFAPQPHGNACYAGYLTTNLNKFCLHAVAGFATVCANRHSALHPRSKV